MLEVRRRFAIRSWKQRESNNTFLDRTWAVCIVWRWHSSHCPQALPTLWVLRFETCSAIVALFLHLLHTTRSRQNCRLLIMIDLGYHLGRHTLHRLSNLLGFYLKIEKACSRMFQIRKRLLFAYPFLNNFLMFSIELLDTSIIIGLICNLSAMFFSISASNPA